MYEVEAWIEDNCIVELAQTTVVENDEQCILLAENCVQNFALSTGNSNQNSSFGNTHTVSTNQTHYPLSCFDFFDHLNGKFTVAFVNNAGELVNIFWKNGKEPKLYLKSIINNISSV